MNVAFVYDRVNKWGGAERVLLALHEIWPDAPLYTAVYDRRQARWADVFSVQTSFLQYLPFAKRHHEMLPLLTPIAFESFTFDEFDLVISITSAEAKGIITKPHTKHICICLTPTRYLWSGYDEYLKRSGGMCMDVFGKAVLKKSVHTVRQWDLIASSRPDKYIAISDVVRKRILTYYKRESDAVIYPPVDTDFFIPLKKPVDDGYYLTVSRLVGYKRTDLIIAACNSLNVPLIVIGDGSFKGKLQRISGDTITIKDEHISDRKLLSYYQRCKAFIYAGEEDFGIVAAEAQSCGKPVIAYKNSGVGEIVMHKKTGILFEKQTTGSLLRAIKECSTMHYRPEDIRLNALRFKKNRFKKHICSFVKGNKNL